jgi:hypothetical protein
MEIITTRDRLPSHFARQSRAQGRIRIHGLPVRGIEKMELLTRKIWSAYCVVPAALIFTGHHRTRVVRNGSLRCFQAYFG